MTNLNDDDIQTGNSPKGGAAPPSRTGTTRKPTPTTRHG